MTIYFEKQLSREQRANLLARSVTYDENLEQVVQEICNDVKVHGDTALSKYSQKFDACTPKSIRIPECEIVEAYESLPIDVRQAFASAATNIRLFHAQQKRSSYTVESIPGVKCWRETRAFKTVGLYIPAGSAPLPSTVFMLGIPAQIAGCERIILCSPPNNAGTVNSSVLAAAHLLGITEIYCLGGAQAIAAMAYGTETIPKVEKIFGPGNKYVTTAKKYVSLDPNGAAIDMLAGPSEVLILADDSANPEVIAWDCLSQAEHDPDSQAIVVMTSTSLAQKINNSIPSLLQNLQRAQVVERALTKSYILITETIDDAISFTNEYAPEHLIINTEDPERIASRIYNAGSVFLGPYSPVTAGDYASGTNHTLPTSGTARWFSGLSVESFEKTLTFQLITKEGLQNLSKTLYTFATVEGLTAHAEAVRCRLTHEKKI